MNSTCRSFAAFFVCLFSLLCVSMASAQQESQTTTQSPVPIVTATASHKRVRYASLGEVHQTRLQVFSATGEQVYDSGLRLGNLIDWKLQDQHNTRLSDGSYLYLITVKDFSQRITQKYGTAVLEREQVYLEQPGRAELPQLQTATLEANRQSESLSLVDRVGAAGLTAASSTSTEGISATGTEPSGTNNVSATPTIESSATGTGSQNYLARWTDNAGTLGNSILYQNAGRIGLDTVTPGAKFHVVGTQGVIGAGTFQLDTPITFGSWSGAYPAFEIVNTNLTNNNVSLFSFSDAPTGASHAGIGAVNTSHGNKWGHLFFYSKQSDGYQVRMGIYNGGYVGIGTTTPTQRLAVNGNIQILGAANGIIFPDGSIQTKATSGTINGTGTTNQIVKFTGPNSFGNSTITESAGNVGIGTTTPIFKLDVAGTINTSGNYDYMGSRLLGVGNFSGNTFVGMSTGHFNTGSGNSFLGNSAGFKNTVGELNTYVGNSAGFNNTDGSRNTFVGTFAGLKNISGNNNSFYGYNAGRENTAGGGNILYIGNSFFGAEAGAANTTGHSNSFFGHDAGLKNTEASGNSFFGTVAGRDNLTGEFNSFFGNQAGLQNKTGNNNSFFGLNAGADNINGNGNAFFGIRAGTNNNSGSNNTFVGGEAGSINTSESNNTMIGYNAKGAFEVTNATAIGYNANVTRNNALVLGCIGGACSSPNNEGTNVGIGIKAPLARLHVVSLSTGANENTATFEATSIGANVSHIHWGTLGSWYIRSAASSGRVILQDTGGNVGIGTSAPNAKLHVTNGNVFIAQPNSLIITSPNGTCWFIKVSDTGVLSSISVACP